MSCRVRELESELEETKRTSAKEREDAIGSATAQLTASKAELQLGNEALRLQNEDLSVQVAQIEAKLRQIQRAFDSQREEVARNRELAQKSEVSAKQSLSRFVDQFQREKEQMTTMHREEAESLAAQLEHQKKQLLEQTQANEVLSRQCSKLRAKNRHLKEGCTALEQSLLINIGEDSRKREKSVDSVRHDPRVTSLEVADFMMMLLNEKPEYRTQPLKRMLTGVETLVEWRKLL